MPIFMSLKLRRNQVYEELHQKWEEQYGASIEQLETGISEVNEGLKALETQEQDYRVQAYRVK